MLCQKSETLGSEVSLIKNVCPAASHAEALA